MIRQAYSGIRPRLVSLAALSAAGFLACASPASNNTGGAGGNSSTGGNGQGGSSHTGGSNGAGGSNTGNGGSNSGSGGSNPGSGGVTNTGGSNPGSGGSHTGGTTGAGGTNPGSGGTNTGSGGTNTGSGGSHTGGTTGSGGAAGSAGGSSGCMNTDPTTINIDSSGYICGNQWGIKGAWYCYSNDTSSPCNPTGVIPWNSTTKGMCLSGTIASGGYDGLGFKVNSGPPGDSTTPGTWNASGIVGFAITVTSGASGKGSNGSVLYVEYPTAADTPTMGADKGESPGVTVPGVAGTSVTYNTLFSDAVIANDVTERKPVDSANLTDVKLAVPADANSRAYDFCITKVVPIMAAPSPLVAAGSYGPAWSNSTGQAVSGINGYAVQNAPFPPNGLPMSMQVMATATGVGFTYTAKQGASGNSPAAFPAVVSGWGPGSGGIQLYGPYQANKTISSLTSVKSSWSFTPGSSGDSAYDIWLGTSAAPTTAPSVELMVWINNGGKQPLGNTTASTAVTGSDGVARYAHTGQANATNQQVVSYVPMSGSATSVTNLDLLQYLKDAVANGYAGLNKDASKVYLLGVQAGFEVYSADTWKTTDYNISIQ